MDDWPNCLRSICSSRVDQLLALTRLLEDILNLINVAPEHGRIFLEDRLVVFDGRGGLAFLRELNGDLVPQVGVIGPELDDLDQLGPRLVALVGCLVVIGQGLMDLDRIGGLLELLVGPLDQLRQPARSEPERRWRRCGSASGSSA